MVKNPEHFPSWKKVLACYLESSSNSTFPVEKCNNPHCENTAIDKLIQPRFTTTDKLEEIFQTQSTGGSFVLCRQCYNKAYTILCDLRGLPCSSCGAYPKSSTTFSRHSPDAMTV